MRAGASNLRAVTTLCSGPGPASRSPALPGWFSSQPPRSYQIGRTYLLHFHSPSQRNLSLFHGLSVPFCVSGQSGRWCVIEPWVRAACVAWGHRDRVPQTDISWKSWMLKSEMQMLAELVPPESSLPGV